MKQAPLSASDGNDKANPSDVVSRLIKRDVQAFSLAGDIASSFNGIELADAPLEFLPMSSAYTLKRSAIAAAIYGFLNPIPSGLFMGALIFDVIYARSAELLWGKSAAWLIVIGLFFAVIPRLINLVQVWGPGRSAAQTSDRVDFWLNLLAIVAAIINSFVHSRDAYAVVPASVWLSACTVILLCVGNVLIAVAQAKTRSRFDA